MATLPVPALCLLALCCLPGGDSSNLSFGRPPLDVSPHPPVRVGRSLLAARVTDDRGRPVYLRSNGTPSRRTVVNPFVTSHGPVTSQKQVTSGRWTPGGQRPKRRHSPAMLSKFYSYKHFKKLCHDSCVSCITREVVIYCAQCCLNV